MQRRVYAAGEVETFEPEPARAQQPAAPAAPRQTAPADGGRPASNSGSNSSASRIDPAQIPRPEVLKTAER